MVLLLGVVCAGVRATEKPAKGKPYPGGPSTMPYEELLDHCDLIITGKVKEIARGKVDVVDAKALKGEYKGDRAVIHFSGSFNRGMTMLSAKPPRAGQDGTFFCLKSDGGKLILAGDPPKGGGHLEEGPELVKKLLEAAKDPKKGFGSKDFAVRFSSAYRLVRAWLAAPEGEKPQLPPGVMETLIAGLVPDKLRGRHVNAAARNCINRALKCNILTLTRYSVNQDALKRGDSAEKVKDIWERTVRGIKARRAGRPDPDASPKVDGSKAAKLAAELVKKLGSDDYATREDADKRLREIGKPAIPAVTAGRDAKDVEVADRCKAILAYIAKKDKLPPPVEKAKFNLDLAEPFVPKAKPKAEAK
jgi:hypothetical protein